MKIIPFKGDPVICERFQSARTMYILYLYVYRRRSTYHGRKQKKKLPPSKAPDTYIQNIGRHFESKIKNNKTQFHVSSIFLLPNDNNKKI